MRTLLECVCFSFTTLPEVVRVDDGHAHIIHRQACERNERQHALVLALDCTRVRSRDSSARPRVHKRTCPHAPRMCPARAQRAFTRAHSGARTRNGNVDEVEHAPRQAQRGPLVPPLRQRGEQVELVCATAAAVASIDALDRREELGGRGHLC